MSSSLEMCFLSTEPQFSISKDLWAGVMSVLEYRQTGEVLTITWNLSAASYGIILSIINSVTVLVSLSLSLSLSRQHPSPTCELGDVL